MRTARGRVVTALVLAATGACAPADRPSPPPAETSIEVVDLAELEAAITARAGKPLLVNFWALWCPPCVAEMPDLAAVARDFRERGGEVLGVSFDLMVADSTLDGVKERMPQFLRERGVDFPILVYADGDPGPVNERYDLPGAIPVTLAFGPDGKEVGRHEGMASREDFARLAERAAAGG